jgi:zinc/manganese transport system permease protein
MTREALVILFPAFLAGLLVLSTHVPLGRIVLDRGIVFIDLAIAQVAGLGVVTADFFGAGAEYWTVQASAAAAALLAAAFLTWSERRLPALQEAIIGVLFVLSACVEILLLASNPHGAENLKELLIGQILWVTPYDLVPVLVLYAAVLALAWRVDLARHRRLFYLAFAVAITASVQLVGIFLVFASLIVPALAARIVATPAPLAYGYAIGLAGYAIGLVCSAWLDLPTGATIVCALVLVAASIVAATFKNLTSIHKN